MKMKYNIKSIVTVILLGILITSCEKEEEVKQDILTETYNDNLKGIFNVGDVGDLNLIEKNELIENYALILASSIKDVELRYIIKEEAKLMFDGDYDILTSTLESLTVRNKETQVRELLIAACSEESIKINSRMFNGNTKISGSEFLERTKMAFPNLQVAVPIHCEEWDTENYIPLVAFLPFDYDDQKAEYVDAFDIYGERHKLSVDVDPSDPVIVVGISERVDKNGERIQPAAEYMSIIPPDSTQQNSALKSAPSAPSNLKISHGPANAIDLWWTDVTNETSYDIWRRHSPSTHFWPFATTGQSDNAYTNHPIASGAKVWYKVRAVNNDGNSAWSPVMATHVSDRNDGEMLRVEAIKFSTSALNAVESWPAGAPEIRLRIVRGTPEGYAVAVYTSGRIEPNRRSWVLNQFWHLQETTINWYTETYGTIFSFDWREEDWNDNVTFTISGSFEDKPDNGTIKPGGSMTIHNDKGGDHIGTTSVVWWDPEMEFYDISGFVFFLTPN